MYTLWSVTVKRLRNTGLGNIFLTTVYIKSIISSPVFVCGTQNLILLNNSRLAMSSFSNVCRNNTSIISDNPSEMTNVKGVIA